MGRLILYIVVGVVIYLVTKELFRPPERFDDGRDTGKGQGEGGPDAGEDALEGGEEMMEDPVCGSFVAKKDAMAVRNGDEVTYFCSDKCRSEYMAKLSDKN